MAVTAEMVKNLREATGARLLDCQKALKETNGVFDDAVAWLRKQNLSQGAKVEGKTAEEGLLGYKLSADSKALAVVELSSNTDFVAKNAEYQKLLSDLASLALDQKLGSVEALGAAQLNGRAVSETVRELAGKIGENIAIKRVYLAQGDFGFYIHHDYKKGGVIEFSGVTGEKAAALGKDLSMHVVFANPKYLKREEVPADQVQKEKDLLADKLKTDPKNAKKPPEILAKIAEGQLGKFYAEICLLDQEYYRPEVKKSITQFLKDQGGDISITRFAHFKVGA